MLLAAVLVLATWCAPADASQPGAVVAIGGALHDENDAVWQRIVALAGGNGARILVVGIASSEPEAAAMRAAAQLTRRGAKAEYLPLAATTAGDPGMAARASAAARRIRAADGVFFTGGAQLRITAAFGQGPLLVALRDLLARGGVVAGTSAGAAVMSTTMFADPPATLQILTSGASDAGTLAPGLGLLDPSILVDQHFLRRGRVGRLLPAQVRAQAPVGIGIDEDTAVIVQDGTLEVVGSSGVLVTQLAVTQASAQPLLIRDARLSLLHAGDRMHLPSLTIFPAKDATAVPLDQPAPRGDAALRERFFPDILGPGILPDAMARLADAGEEEIVGLAFDAGTGAPHPGLGFEFRLARTPQSQAWRHDHGTSMSGVRLDITPVRMAQPLYQPLPGQPGD